MRKLSKTNIHHPIPRNIYLNHYLTNRNPHSFRVLLCSPLYRTRIAIYCLIVLTLYLVIIRILLVITYYYLLFMLLLIVI